jgi:RNA polymerase sigma-70 factor (ECF subfamily)
LYSNWGAGPKAAIQAVHASAERFEGTDWDQIVSLYDHLLAISPSPVIELNRAIAICEAEGPLVCLKNLDRLLPQLDGYYPLHAARAEVFRRLGRLDDSISAFETAASLATSDSDRNYLATQATLLRAR